MKEKQKTKSVQSEGLDRLILSKEVVLKRNSEKEKNVRNVLVVGMPGCGKTRGFFKPNLLEKTTGDIVVHDPTEELLETCGHALKEAGYTIKVLNLSNFSQSDHYNPFMYFTFTNKEKCKLAKDITDEDLTENGFTVSDLDVMAFVDTLIDYSRTYRGDKNPFWDRADQLLLITLVYYMFENFPVRKWNFKSLLKLLQDYTKRQYYNHSNGDPSVLEHEINEWEHGKFVLKDGKKINLTLSDRAYRSMLGPASRMGREPNDFPRSKEEMEAKIHEEYINNFSEEERNNHVIDSDGFVRMKSWVNEYGITVHTANKTSMGIKSWNMLIRGVDIERTLPRIVLEVSTLLSVFNIHDVESIICDDTMHLEQIGIDKKISDGTKENQNEKIAWFVCYNINCRDLSLLIRMFFTQAMNMVTLNAENNNGVCSYPVDFFIDEMQMLEKIPHFDFFIRQCKKMNCGINMSLFSIESLKFIYPDAVDSILDSLDCVVAMRTSSRITAEYLVKWIGQHIDPFELYLTDKSLCYVVPIQQNDVKTICGHVYEIKNHPRYTSLYERILRENQPQKQYKHVPNLNK